MSHSACTPHAQRTHVRMYVYMSKECHQVLERIQRRVVHWTSVHIKWIAGKKILASTPMTFVCTRNGLQKTIKLRFQVMQTTLSQSTQTHIHTHILAHTYTYTHTHTHIHTHTHAHTHAHTHTHHVMVTSHCLEPPGAFSVVGQQQAHSAMPLAHTHHSRHNPMVSHSPPIALNNNAHNAGIAQCKQQNKELSCEWEVAPATQVHHAFRCA